MENIEGKYVGMEKSEACAACGHSRGRPPKKAYDPVLLMGELIDAVPEVYQATNEIKATAINVRISIRNLLEQSEEAADHSWCVGIY